MTSYLGAPAVKTPKCPDHGREAMRSMESVGAPAWFTCAAPAPGPGGVCGKSAHGTPRRKKKRRAQRPSGARQA